MMDAVLAREIIAEATNQGVTEGPIPEDDTKAIEKAEWLVETAEEAFKKNVRGVAVESILNLAERSNGATEEEPQIYFVNEYHESLGPYIDDLATSSSIQPWGGYEEETYKTVIEKLNNTDFVNGLEDLAHIFSYEDSHKCRSRVIQAINNKAEAMTERTVDEEFDRIIPPVSSKRVEQKEVIDSITLSIKKNSEDNYDGLIEDVENKLKSERLHIPSSLPEDKAELPYDFSKIPPRELHSLYSQFTSYVYRVNYLLMKEEILARRCKDAAEETFNHLIAAADKVDESGKQKLRSVLEAEINDLDAVKQWRKRQRKHEDMVAAYKSERDSYARIVDSLSRLETMRQNEWERSRR